MEISPDFLTPAWACTYTMILFRTSFLSSNFLFSFVIFGESYYSPLPNGTHPQAPKAGANPPSQISGPSFFIQWCQTLFIFYGILRNKPPHHLALLNACHHGFLELIILFCDSAFVQDCWRDAKDIVLHHKKGTSTALSPKKSTSTASERKRIPTCSITINQGWTIHCPV